MTNCDKNLIQVSVILTEKMLTSFSFKLILFVIQQIYIFRRKQQRRRRHQQQQRH